MNLARKSALYAAEGRITRGVNPVEEILRRLSSGIYRLGQKTRPDRSGSTMGEKPGKDYTDIVCPV